MKNEEWPRLQELFEAALDREAGERAAFLDAACGRDEVLRARIEALLRSHEKVGDFLQGPLPGSEAAPDLATAPEDPVDSLAGRAIGHYRVRRRIAAGGMGLVYLAEQEKPRRTVALKLIRSDVLSAETLRRFEHETEVLGRLQHPGIAQIFEAGTADLGHGPQPFFAMEFVEGRPVTEHAADRRLGTRDRLALLIKICRAVEHAHRNGVIHRDLKPANILVDGAGQPKVLDFGIARAIDSDLLATTLRTDAGQLVGTIQYMSPEQVAGDPRQLDTRSDVYALGVVGYELLSGRLPYDVRRASLPEAIRIISGGDPVPLGVSASVLRGDLETILAKALEKDREHRYQSASDLAADIERYLREEPIAARPPSAAYQLRKLVRRHRLPVALASGAFVLVTALAILAAVQAARSARSRERAERINAYLQGMLASFTPAEARGTTIGLRQVLDGAARRIESGLAGDPEVAAALRQTIGEGYRGLGLFDLAEPHLRTALAAREAALGPAAIEVADSLHSLAELLAARSDYDGAEPLFRRALAIRRGRLGDDDLKVAATLGDLAFLLRERGEYAEAEPLALEALAIRRRRLGEDHADVAAVLAGLGSLYKDQGDFAAAEPLYRQALAIRRRLLGDEDLSVASSLNLLASLLQDSGNHAGAEPLYREALTIRRKLLGEDHAEVVASLNNLAVLLHERGDPAAAEPMLRDVIARRRSLVGERPYLAGSLNSLAILLLDRGDLMEAEALARESLSIRRRLLSPRHPDLARTLETLGLIFLARGDFSGAEPLLRESLSIRRESLGAGSDVIADSLLALGELLLTRGESAEAEPLLREAVTTRARTRPNAPWSVAEAESLLGTCLAEAGRDEEAQALLLTSWETLKTHWGERDHRTQAAARRLSRFRGLRD